MLCKLCTSLDKVLHSLIVSSAVSEACEFGSSISFCCFRAGEGEYLQVGIPSRPLAAAAASVGDERRVRQSSSPTSHGEEHGAWRCNHVGGCLLELP